MNMYEKGRYSPDGCSSLDAAYERKALMDGSCHKPVFPENWSYSNEISSVGVKHDAGKPRYELIPPEALDGVTRILTFGATKYGDRNYEKGINYSRVFGAAMRHLWTWWRGEENDPETGESHLHHAACCVMMLQTYVERKMDKFDDRP